MSSYLHMSIESKTRCTLDETADLGAGEVLRERGELEDVDVRVHDAVRAHLGGVDLEDLHAALLIREGDLHVHFETSRTEKGFVNHVETVGHTDDEDIVQLVDTIHLVFYVSLETLPAGGSMYLGE